MIKIVAPLLLFFLQASAPATCTWGNPEEVGVLDNVINESSGMAVSRRIPNRTYRNNDSGDTGRFFTMDLAGRNMKIVNIAGFNPIDNEDMAIGPCGATADCIFIGDIGDNSSNRRNIELVIVEERAEFPSEVQPWRRVRIQYPDGPHNAESLAVHPNGDVYITTKSSAGSRIFRLKRDQWMNSKNAMEILEPVLALDWAKLLPASPSGGRLATAMDISPDGKRFLILTYDEAVEFLFDLSVPTTNPDTWKEGNQFRKIPLTTLEQEEAIAYLPDGRGFLYDTERPIAILPARIFKVACR